MASIFISCNPIEPETKLSDKRFNGFFDYNANGKYSTLTFDGTSQIVYTTHITEGDINNKFELEFKVNLGKFQIRTEGTEWSIPKPYSFIDNKLYISDLMGNNLDEVIYLKRYEIWNK